MLQTDFKELTTTLTTSLVKEFRLLQELVDTLREEKLAFKNKTAKEIRRATALKKMVLNDLVQNADERDQQKLTLARLLGMSGEVSCRDLTKVVGEDEAVQILNLLEGSMAVWKVAAELNKNSLQYVNSALEAKGKTPFTEMQDAAVLAAEPEQKKPLLDSRALSQQFQEVIVRITGTYG